MAYERIEPFGEAREDYRAGMIAAMVANTVRDPKKQEEPWVPEDFFPPYQTPEMRIVALSGQQPSPDKLQAKLMAWAAMMNQPTASRQSTKRRREPKEE